MIYGLTMHQRILFAVVVCLVMVLGVFGLAEAGEQPVLEVVASIAPLADLVHQVGGERVSVHQLVPPGASPHTYEPVPSDLVRLSGADAFFVIGIGLELFLDRLIQDLESRIPVFQIHQGIELIEDGHHHHGEDHHHGEGNPHIWLSLRNAQVMVEQIAGILGELDPAGSLYYNANSEHYRRKLAELDQWFIGESEQFTSRDFIASHGAWPYLARDYHLRQAGSIEQFPGREATPREIQELIDSIRQSGIRVVFAEPQLSQKAAAVLAEEAGVKLAVLDPLGNFPEMPYLEIMRHNLENILEVLR